MTAKRKSDRHARKMARRKLMKNLKSDSRTGYKRAKK